MSYKNLWSRGAGSPQITVTLKDLGEKPILQAMIGEQVASDFGDFEGGKPNLGRGGISVNSDTLETWGTGNPTWSGAAAL